MKKISLLAFTVFFVISSLAQVSKQQAKRIVMETVVNNDSTQVNVFMEPFVQTDIFYKQNLYDSIQAPYSSYWLFFIDDLPNYGWGHDCRFVFLNSQNGKFAVVSSQIPKWGFGMCLEVVNQSITITIPQTDYLAPTNTVEISNVNDGKYAVLFTGGETEFRPTAFWNALSHSYTGLLEHGFKKENIYVLSCDGGTGNMFTNESLDLDHDGSDDILFNKTCNVSNLQAIFSDLANIMDESDLLYVYGTMHGWPDGNHTYLQLWQGERLYDTVLAAMIAPIKCSQIIFNLYSCYAGGMGEAVYSINNPTKKTILTCVDNRSVLRIPSFSLYSGMDSYNYFINTAFRHWHPNYQPKKCNPWLRYRRIGHLEDTVLFIKAPSPNNVLTDYDFDSLSGNHNGIYEIDEIINYVNIYDNFFYNYGLKYYDCGFLEDLLSLHGISGDVVNNQQVNGSFHIEDSLNIYCDSLSMATGSCFYLFDADLNIKPSATLFVGDSCKIVAKCDTCKVVIEGSMPLGNGVVFEAKDGARLEIHFDPDANLDIRKATFINCDLIMPRHNINLDSCTFTNTPVFVNHTSNNNSAANDTIIIKQCNFISAKSHISDAIHIERCAHYMITNCTIETINTGSFGNGIYIYYSGRSTGYKLVAENEIVNCSTSGISLFGSIGSVIGNTVHNNGYGVKIYNLSNVINFSGNCDAPTLKKTQYIHDNLHNEVYMAHGCLPAIFRYNAIVDDDNEPFVYHDHYAMAGVDPNLPWDVPSNYDVSLNYWGNSFNPSLHLYSTDNELTFVYLPYWTIGDCNDDFGPPERLFKTADSLVEEGAYHEAKDRYLQIVEDYPESHLSENAMKSLFSLEEYLGGNYASLQDYFNTNPVLLSNARLSRLASSLSNQCDIMMGRYDRAIAWYEDVLTNSETNYNDSVFAAIDLGDLYLRIKSEKLKTVGKLQNYVPENEEAHRAKTASALSSLPQTAKKTTLVENTGPVRNLEASVDGSDMVFLTWDFPEEAAHGEMTVTWSNMVHHDWAGTHPACSWDMMQHFEPMDVRNLSGWKIESITCMTPVIDPIYNNPDGEFYVKVWKGEAQNLELMCQQLINEPVGGEYQNVPLNEDVFVEEGRDLWIGLYGDQPFTYPWPIDDYIHAPDSKGFILELYNEVDGECVPYEWIDYFGLYSGNVCISATLSSPDAAITAKENPGRENRLTGYKIYRNGLLIKTIPYPFMTYFTDTHYSKELDVEYCVTAVYGEEESEPACLTATLEGVQEETLDVSLFPNPANGQVTVTAEDIRRVEIRNLLGQKVASVDGNDGGSLTIDLSGLAKGVYLVTMWNKEGAGTTKKLTVE